MVNKDTFNFSSDQTQQWHQQVCTFGAMNSNRVYCTWTLSTHTEYCSTYRRSYLPDKQTLIKTLRFLTQHLCTSYCPLCKTLIIQHMWHHHHNKQQTCLYSYAIKPCSKTNLDKTDKSSVHQTSHGTGEDRSILSSDNTTATLHT